MKKLILFFTFLTANTLLFAQLYEIPLDQKIDESQIIVEGKVVKSESFIGNYGRIYTAHKVEIQRIFKGTDFRESHLTIITRGGKVDDRITTWTHLLNLEEGESGIFFLRPTIHPVPIIRDFPNDNFDVFSSSQGFLKYVDGLEGKLAVTQFQRYANIESELVGAINLRTNETPKVLENNSIYI